MATSAGPALRKLGDLHGNKAEEEGALAILGLAASSVVEVGATTRGLLPADDGGMPGARAAARTTHVEARCGTTSLIRFSRVYHVPLLFLQLDRSLLSSLSAPHNTKGTKRQASSLLGSWCPPPKVLRSSPAMAQCAVAGCHKAAQGSTTRCIGHGGGRRCKKPGCPK